jgi:hypothetical protein
MFGVSGLGPSLAIDDFGVCFFAMPPLYHQKQKTSRKRDRCYSQSGIIAPVPSSPRSNSSSQLARRIARSHFRNARSACRLGIGATPARITQGASTAGRSVNREPYAASGPPSSILRVNNPFNQWCYSIRG